jgi:hypothetical protein
MLTRILRDGRLIELVAEELTELATLQVDDQDTIMVGSHPQPSTVVGLDIPYIQTLRSIVDMAAVQQVYQ